MAFSVASVTLVSVRAPPFKVSLPLTPSMEFTVSFPPDPERLSAPALSISWSLPPPPVRVLLVSEPVRVSALEDPRRFSTPTTKLSEPSPLRRA